MKRGALGPRRSHPPGYVLLGTLILLFVVGIVATSFLVLASYEVRQAHEDLKSQRAFWLAEAGKERALRLMNTVWRRPPDHDTWLFQGALGPDGGSYSVQVLVDTAGIYAVDKGFMIQSVGHWGGRDRRIRQRVSMAPFSSYAYFTDTEDLPGGGPIWFISRDTIQGRIHSNGTFHINGSPQFLGHMTTASDYMIAAPSTHVDEPDDWPVGSNNPYFGDGLEIGVDPIPLPTDTDDLKAAAQAGGLFIAPPTILEMGKDINGNAAPGSFRYKNTGGGPWSAGQINLLNPAVIYVNNDVEIFGVVDGEVTISSDKTIKIVDDLTYLASDANGAPLPGCNDLLGLVAEENIVFAENPPATDNLKVNSVLMALDESITAENWQGRAPSQKLTIWGGLIQKRRGVVGQFGLGGVISHGYEKDYHYDPRVTARTPPLFPMTGNYDEVAWEETWDASNPF